MDVVRAVGAAQRKGLGARLIGSRAWCQGDMVAAEHYIGEALAIYTELGRKTSIGMCQADLTPVLVSKGELQQAIALAQQAVAITRAVDGHNMLTVSLCYLGSGLHCRRRPE